MSRRSGLCQIEPKSNWGSIIQTRWHSHQTRASPSFRVHEIEPAREDTCQDTAGGVDDSVDLLSLQPERLEFESDLGHSDNIGSRLVDSPSRKHDFALWEELLRYRKQRYGEKGILAIWHGLTKRVSDVQLPVVGKRADFLWQSFVDLGYKGDKRDWILSHVMRYARELWDKTGSRWGPLYISVVCGLLERGMLKEAVFWHKMLRYPHLQHPDQIVQVLRVAITAPLFRNAPTTPEVEVIGTPPALRAFLEICQDTDFRCLYGPIITTLLSRGYFVDALVLHDFLTERQDHPECYEVMHPLLQYAETHKNKGKYRKLQEYAKHRFGLQTEPTAQQSRSHESDSSPTTNNPENSNPGGDWLRQKKPIKDEFAARLFATNAFTFEMVVGGLRMFGAESIGPQSLRELAIRAHGCQDILRKIDALQRSGISVGDSVFARLVRKLAIEDRGLLLQELLTSDLHPDAFEDAGLQESLLVQHYMARGWPQYNLTLAVLDLHSDEGPEMFNVHFRKHVVAREFNAAARLVDEMTLRREVLAYSSLDFMIGQLLPPRRKGVGPPMIGRRRRNEEEDDEIGFIFRVLKRVVPVGVFVSSDVWIELLKRVGMSRRWDDLGVFTLWIASHYGKSPLPAAFAGRRPTGSTSEADDHILKDIFNPQMQAAIVAWSFKMRPSTKQAQASITHHDPSNNPNHDTPLTPWTGGLALLRRLQHKNIQLHEDSIRHACRQRLAVLFGRPRHSSRRWNRLLRRENPFTVHQVVADLTRVWGGSLFRGREVEDLEGLVNPPSSGISWRRTARTVVRENRYKGAAFVRSR